MKDKLNRAIAWINRTGRRYPAVGPLGVLILVVIAFGLGLLALTYLPWILGIVILLAVIYFGVLR